MIEILKILYSLILLILGIYSLVSFKNGHKTIKFYAIITMITDLMGMLYLFIYETPNAYLYNVYSIIEIPIWLFLIRKLIKVKEYYLYLFFIIHLLIFLFLGSFNLERLNNNGFLFNNLSIVIFIVFYYFEIIKRNLNINGYFWIFAGALFYNLGGFLLTGLVQFIAKEDPNLGSSLFRINLLLNIVYYSLFIYGLVKLNLSNKIEANIVEGSKYHLD